MEERLSRRLVALTLLAAACASSKAPPTPNQPTAYRPPDLTGKSVMLLPAQPGPGGAPGGEPVPGLDRELNYWLGNAAPRVHWVFPPALRQAIDANPSLEIDIDALAVSSFHRAEVKVIGDPLFGDLRRLGAVVDARYALVPVAATWFSTAKGQGEVRANFALIDTRGGRVLWFGAIAGEPGIEGSEAAAASAAQALVNVLFH